MDYQSQDRQKLKSYYESLRSYQEILGKSKELHLSVPTFRALDVEIGRIRQDFQNLLPPFDRNSFGYDQTWQNYELAPVEAYVGACIARIKVALEETQNTPVTHQIEFLFIRDSELRNILERDYSEIQRVFIAECWKSVIVLSGGSIEAILLDRLKVDESRAKAANSAPTKTDLARWDLSDLIKVGVELKIVEPSAETLAGVVRQYRNLIHPGNELRNKLSIGRLDAESALNVLRIIHRDLSR